MMQAEDSAEHKEALNVNIANFGFVSSDEDESTEPGPRPCLDTDNSVDQSTLLTASPRRLVVSEDSCFIIDDTLAKLHVRLFTHLNIFTCMQCFTGVSPDHLESHMYQVHKFSCPRSKTEILEIAQHYGVMLHSEDTIFPDAMDPIPDLETYDGFCCTAVGCYFAVQKHRSMLQHLRSHHNKGEVAESISCIVQKPFSSVRSYRRVSYHSPSTVSTETTHVEQDIVILTSAFQKAVLEDNVLRTTTDPADTPRWLERLYWPTLVHGISPKVLVSLVGLPRDEENCLFGVRQALSEYFERIGKIVQSDRFTTTLEHLCTSKEDKSVIFVFIRKIESKAFSLLDHWRDV